MMIWNYWRLKREYKAKTEMFDSLLKSNKRLLDENQRLRNRENVLEGRARDLRDNVSVAGMAQIECQDRLDDLRLSVKGIRKACFRFLELTEDPKPETDPKPPPPADAKDKLRDMMDLPRDGSQVLRGDPLLSGRPRVQG